MVDILQSLAKIIPQRLPTPGAVASQLRADVGEFARQLPQASYTVGQAAKEGLINSELGFAKGMLNMVYDPAKKQILPQAVFNDPNHPLRKDPRTWTPQDAYPLVMMATTPTPGKSVMQAQQSVSTQMGGEGGAFVDASGRVTKAPVAHALTAVQKFGIEPGKGTDVITPLLKKGYMRTDPTATSFNVEIQSPVLGLTERQLEHIVQNAGNRKIYIDTPDGLLQFKNSIDLTTFIHGNPVVTNKTTEAVTTELEKLKQLMNTIKPPLETPATMQSLSGRMKTRKLWGE